MMINEVAPKPCNEVIPVAVDENEGINATTPNDNAPSKVTLLKILSSASAVQELTSRTSSSYSQFL